MVEARVSGADTALRLFVYHYTLMSIRIAPGGGGGGEVLNLVLLTAFHGLSFLVSFVLDYD